MRSINTTIVGIDESHYHNKLVISKVKIKDSVTLLIDYVNLK